MDKISWWEDILQHVQKPGRYAGGEWNERRKDPSQADVRVALIFPDVYEIGMSYLGQKILYSILNDQPRFLAERAFAPWPDMEKELRRRGRPLFSLESKIPLVEFDILGFSLLYELNDSNILTVLDLAGIPLQAAERDESHPLILGGGPAAFNPEPLAEIFDALFIGDGEDAFLEIAETVGRLKKENQGRERILKELSGIEGVYVPSFYRPVLTWNSNLLAVDPISGAPARIRKRICFSLNRAAFPTDIIVPNIQAVFDRVAVETARGCPQRCRFCQATHIYFPYRVREPEAVIRKVLDSLRATGFEDASLSALSLGDYPSLDETISRLMEELSRRRVSLSVSSLRPKGLSEDLVRNIIKVRKTGFTLVPEAGTERLRRVINKNLADQDILDAAANAFSRGWRLIKLYFMIGLPTEREDDLEGIVRLSRELVALGKSILGTAPQINAAVSSFIPKPHTPFQWLAMEEENVLLEKQRFLGSRMRLNRSVKIKDHPTSLSVLECIFSRGDRVLNKVLIQAWTRGARFDGWKDMFRGDVWEKAFDTADVPKNNYLGPIDPESRLPWEHIETGIKKTCLLEEMRKALKEERTAPCAGRSCDECRGCESWAKPGRSLSAGLVPDEPLEALVSSSAVKDRPIRYQLRYSKTGNTRFLSHLDLASAIRRIMKRAGVEIAHSQGFHPKMLISYAAALPLGMEGWREVLDFKSRSELEAREFLEIINKTSPMGIRFLDLRRLEDSMPPLNERIRAVSYSLDLDVPAVKGAVERLKEISLEGRDLMEAAKDIVRDAVAKQGLNADDIHLDEENRKLIMVFPYRPERPVRPQAIIEQAFGLTHSVFLLKRENIMMAGD